MNKDIEYTKRQYNLDANIVRYGEAIDKVGLWNSEKNIFRKFIAKTDRILDLGCGAGRTTINLFKEGYTNIKGIDLADKLIDYAKDYCNRNNLQIDFEVGDATNLVNELDNTYDVAIFSFNGIQCIPGYENRKKVLREVYRVLKPDGLFIFTAHDRHDPRSHHRDFWDKVESDWSRGIKNEGAEVLGDLISSDPSGEECFIHFSTIDEMINFVEEEGFEVVMHEHSYNITDENEAVKEFAGGTVFYVVRKK